MFRKFLKPLSTSALPSCRPDVISAVFASLICAFIPTDFGMPRAVDIQKSLQPKTVHGCVPVGATHSRRFIGSVRMMTCVLQEASHCIACVTASISMVRPEVVTLCVKKYTCSYMIYVYM